MICRMLALAVAASFLVTCAAAGEFNQVLSIGDKAPSWKDLPATDGKMHSLDEFKDKDAVVLVFTAASCDTAVAYEERMNSLATQFGGPDGKVGMIAVCVNHRAPADRLDKLTDRAKKQKFAYPVMYDESQKIGKDYGAIFTPEFYVLDKQRKIAYMGAMDDATDATKVTKRFVEDAVNAVLKGEAPEVKETAARGCVVRYARERQ